MTRRLANREARHRTWGSARWRGRVIQRTRRAGRRALLADATIKTNVGNIPAKLGLRNRVQAVVLAYESGFLTPGGARAD
jgi:hypothetical protein